LNKKQTAPDGGEGDKDQLIPTFPNWQTINQLNKKTAPNGGEGDKDQLIPTFFLHAVPGIQPTPRAVIKKKIM
jgi:hypothetical protein